MFPTILNNSRTIKHVFVFFIQFFFLKRQKLLFGVSIRIMSKSFLLTQAKKSLMKNLWLNGILVSPQWSWNKQHSKRNTKIDLKLNKFCFQLKRIYKKSIKKPPLVIYVRNSNSKRFSNTIKNILFTIQKVNLLEKLVECYLECYLRNLAKLCL